MTTQPAPCHHRYVACIDGHLSNVWVGGAVIAAKVKNVALSQQREQLDQSLQVPAWSATSDNIWDAQVSPAGAWMLQCNCFCPGSA